MREEGGQREKREDGGSEGELGKRERRERTQGKTGKREGAGEEDRGRVREEGGQCTFRPEIRRRRTIE